MKVVESSIASSSVNLNVINFSSWSTLLCSNMPSRIGRVSLQQEQSQAVVNRSLLQA